MGGLGGGAIGNMVGFRDEGRDLGSNLGAALSKWLGSGAYNVRVNSVLKPDGTIPMMHKTGQSIIVRHKEFVCDIAGGTGAPSVYNIGRTIYLNPGLGQSFPWLSTIARQFQEYTWRGMVFHFVSTSGQSVASTNTALGTVMMHTDYRVTAAAPASKAELLNEYFASDAKPSECFVHPIECDPKENPYNVQYVRTDAVPSGEDPKSYDLGKVNVATVGFPSASMNVGELWVTYEVELRKPQISHLGYDGLTLAAASTGIATTSPFGTGVTYSINQLGIVADLKTITFPAGCYGYYLINVTYSNTTSTMSCALSSITYTNCTAANSAFMAPGYESAAYDQTAATVQGGLTSVIYISNPALSAVVTVTYGTLTGVEHVKTIVTHMSNVLA
jgi:hypothetical protein